MTTLYYIDSFLFIYYIMFNTKTTFLYVTIIIIICQACGAEITCLNHQLCKTDMRKITTKLRHFRYSHTKLCTFLAYFNSQIVSPFFFAYILLHMAFNSCIYMINTYGKVALVARFSTSYVMGVQLLLPLVLGQCLLTVNKKIKASGSKMYKILNQTKMTKLAFCDKWKLLVYCENLYSKKLLLSAGSFGCVQRKSLLNVSIRKIQ